ncbi:hypothetical protein [Pedobacter agri]|uniref:hypothetical protein n=1 Tax=Pedobacter agri TaxID=454586 RepID=UPI00292D13D4|nr:hypothetical protein [Pedobacter agri]
MPDNLNNASRASQFQNQLDQLGSLGESVNNFDFNLDAIELVVGLFIDEVINSIDESGMAVTGSASDIRMEVEGTEIKLYGKEHLLYQDAGVNPVGKKLYDTPYQYEDKMPPIAPIKEWIKRKNINLRNNEFFGGEGSPFAEFDEEKAIESLAWAISKSIYSKTGIPPKNVFRKHFPKLIEDMKGVVAGFTAGNLISTIRNKYGNDVLNKSIK